ncbi:PGF-pre-PGF domain-containing protein, partial [Candidatus Woesearchaeota archaeon]|nr:PGF-pre-PGF domain-containing protein [Candidatus Woesearchaeota archaeon]
MQKKSGDFSKNCSYLKLVMLLVLSAVIVLMAISVASAVFLPVGGSGVFDINLTANTGFNFSTGASTASFASADIFYNGTMQPSGMGSQDDGAFRIWLASTNAARISGSGPNINLDYMYQVMSKDFMPSGSSQRTFPVYQVDDGINLYTEKLNYVLLKVTFRNASLLRFSYKMNNQTDNQTVGTQPTAGCYAQTTSSACFAAGACFWDSFGNFCKDNTQTGGGGSSGGGGTMATVFCAAFNVNVQECGRLNSSLCTNTSSSCTQGTNFDNSRGLKCEDITGGSSIQRQGMCDNVPLMSTCCSWTGSACVSNATKTTCKGAFNNQSSGAMKFCEDAGNSSSLCAQLKTTQYMPCRFDNSSTPERITYPKCVFDSSTAFGGGSVPMGGGLGGGGFFDITTQAACQASGGNWKTFTYEKIDPLYGTKSTVTETHCEPSFGSKGGGGAMSCDQMCPACENDIKSASLGGANTTTQAKSQCENSSLGTCKFVNNSKAFNGLGFCNFDKAYTDFGGSGNCQNDCFACFGSTTCTSSQANCTWTNDQFGSDFNSDGKTDGWCDPKAYQSFNSCATNCNACFTETTCNTSAQNTGIVNCTWIDSYSPKATHPLYNVSNAGINPQFGFVGCIKVTKTPGPGFNRSGELCMYPGDEDGNGVEGCNDPSCSNDPACGFGMGGGFKPTAGGAPPPGGGPSNSSQLGFGSDCFSRDNTNQTYCTSLSGCTWKQIGSFGLCDPLFDQQMGGGMQMDAPPTILGTDATGDAGGQDWLDIAGLGYHDSPQNMDLGLGLVNITNFVGCNKFHIAKSLNRTGKYYRFIDVDANASTGCNATSVGGINDVSGYEYKVVYENNGTSEVKLLFKCGLNANQFLNNASKWVLITKAQVASMDFGCYIDDFMISQGFAGVHIQLINKVDISNPKQNIRVYAATANATTNDTWPVDIAGPFYYTPGSIDFKMEDCNNPGADIDGDGYTSDQDPDCAKFKQYGFVPIEGGPKCKDGIDNDGNELTDCNDPGCKYDNFQCGGGAGFGYKKDNNDKTAPKVSMQSMDVFPDGAMVKIITNEPSNATVEFYGTSSTCTSLNETVVDFAVTTATPFDDYKPFSDVKLTTFGADSRTKLDYTLRSNTTYFFKTKICDLSDNCAKSACQNFTTKASSSTTDCSTCSFIVSFDEYVPKSSFGSNHPLGNLTFTIDFGGDGVQDFNSTGGGTGKKTNYSNTLNTTITFNNPQATEPWEITLKGLDIAGSISSAISNLSSAFLYNASSGNTFMGMDGDIFETFNQNYGVDSVAIKLPVVGNKLMHCEEANLSNCVDVTSNATKIAQDSSSSTWQFPVTTGLKFSLYQVEGAISFRSDKSSYNCNTGSECFMYINVTNDNVSLKNLLYNISIGILKIGGINGTSSKFGLSTWNGTGFNFNGTVSSDVDGNLSLVTLKLDRVNLTDTAVQFRLNMSLYNFTKGGRFTFLFNATMPTAVNMNASYINNISFGGLQPYIDMTNLTSPANSDTVTTTRTTFTYVLFSEFNHVLTYNQTCNLYINNTLANSSSMVNGTSVTLSNNFTLVDATYAWNVSCTNNESETSYSATRSFTVAEPPNVTITSPTLDSRTNDNTTTVSFTLNDTSDLNAQSIVVVFNTTRITATQLLEIFNGSTEGSCSGTTKSKNCTFTLNATNATTDGVWTINVSVKDSAGNQGSHLITYISDATNPQINGIVNISYNNVLDRYVANSTTVLLYVNFTDNVINVTGPSTVFNGSGLNLTAEIGGTRYGLNKTVIPYWNGTIVLRGDEGFNQLTLRGYDNATNVVTATVNYWIDTITPKINITGPSTNSTTINTATGGVTFNWTVDDANLTSTNITIYDLNGLVVTSMSTGYLNGTVNATITFKPGTYTASFAATDSADNGIKLPSTALNFTVNAPQDTAVIERELNATLRDFADGRSYDVKVLYTNGSRPSGSIQFNQTLLKQILVAVNTSITNVSIDVNITALGNNFNENKTTAVRIVSHPLSADANVTAKLLGLRYIDNLVLFKNMSQYIADNSYENAAGSKQWVTILFNKSIGRLKALYINDDEGKDVVVLSPCSGNSTPSSTPNKSNACFTNSAYDVTLFVPHLSGGILVDPDLATPIINFTTPAENISFVSAVSDRQFVLAGLVQGIDLNASSCTYNISNTAGSIAYQSLSFTPTQVESGSTNYTINVNTEGINLTNGTTYNATVRCVSNNVSNIASKMQPFYVDDSTRPKINSITPSPTTGTTVTLTWTLTTNENATCRYVRDSSTTNFSAMTTFTTTGTKSHTYAPSYTADTSGTLYFACNDSLGNGNNANSSQTNSSTFSVDVTPAAAAAAATSSGGGGSTTKSAVTAEGTSATKSWVTPLNAGATATMNILNDKIPITSLSVEVANRVEKVEIKVTKLDKAPATAVPEGTGKVHSYLKVDTQNLKAEDIKSAKFKFKVDKKWLADNSYTAQEILLTRFDGVKWQDLPTKYLGATDGVETFEATSPGFSTFAVVARTKVEAVKAVEEAKKAEEASKEPEVKEEPKAEEKKEEKKAEAPVIPTQPKKPYT